VNILTGIGAFIVLLILFFFSLGWITGYGKTEKVPNVVGLDVIAAQKNLTELGFDVVLQDSVYVDTLARNAVLRQIPESDEIVKKGRTVYLTINRIVAPLIDMPYLKVLGLRLGVIKVVVDRNKNVIIDQMVGGRPISPGSKVASGTLINFLVGDGGASIGFDVPDLLGLTVEMARAKIMFLGLQFGSISSVVDIQDTANAFVIQQNPNPFSGELDSLGMPMKNVTFQGGTIDLVIDKVAPEIKRDTIR
jgi:beta-lactam-binding protein with PASTA domain